MSTNVKLIIRSLVIKTLARIGILSYKVIRKPITKARLEIEKTFGEPAVEAIGKLLSFYGGYSSVDDMINRKAYKYIHLGDKLDQLGNYAIMDVNGLSYFVNVQKNARSRFGDHILIYVKNGMKYDITPYGKLPNDLPDGEYELLHKVGSNYELVSYHDNPNDITIKTRNF